MPRTPGYDRRASASTNADHVNFRIDGVIKSLDGVITGKTLNRLAGGTDDNPVTLKTGGVSVPYTDDLIDLRDGQEFTTT